MKVRRRNGGTKRGWKPRVRRRAGRHISQTRKKFRRRRPRGVVLGLWVLGWGVRGPLSVVRCRVMLERSIIRRFGRLTLLLDDESLRSAARGLPDHVFKGRHPPTISRPRRLRRATVPCKGGSRAWTLGRADDCGTKWAVGGGQWAVRNYCKLPPHGTLFSYRGTNSAAEARTARRCALHVP